MAIDVYAHKTDVGGVKLNLRSENEISQANQDIENSAREIPGAFLGVVVEPMIQTDG
jgi:acyl-CoA synthetase (NDP forming)